MDDSVKAVSNTATEQSIVQHWCDELKKLVLNSPHFVSRHSLASIHSSAAQFVPNAVFLGIGLCNSKKVSLDLPLDLAGMLMSAEQVRRSIIARSLIIFVADDHAKTNGHDPVLVEERASSTVSQLEKVCAIAGLSRVKIIRASRLHQTDAFQAFLSQVQNRLPSEHEYVQREVADIASIAKVCRGIVKLGWTVSTGASSSCDNKSDEVMFDQCFQTADLRVPAVFVYTKPGMAFDDARPRVSPYLCFDRQSRILLDSAEDVAYKIKVLQGKVSASTFNAVKNHLNSISRTYCHLFGTLHGRLEERLQLIIQNLTGLSTRTQEEPNHVTA